MLAPRYPNLELLAYKAQEVVNIKFAEKIEEIRKERRWFIPDFEAVVFRQTWSSTCTAFDITPGGAPTVGGQAFTNAYTVIMCEENLGVWVVFVDDRMCYVVDDPTDTFFEDMKNHNMKSLNKAKSMY